MLGQLKQPSTPSDRISPLRIILKLLKPCENSYRLCMRWKSHYLGLQVLVQNYCNGTYVTLTNQLKGVRDAAHFRFQNLNFRFISQSAFTLYISVQTINSYIFF
jgi:hypothetical protein